MTYSKNKTQKSTIREESPLFDLISPKKKYKYICNCMLCKGKEVDARTQTKHANDEIVWKSNKERKKQLASIEARKFNYEGKLIVEIISYFMQINSYIGHPIYQFLTCVTFTFLN
jgi:hypothetical protein